jgi:acylphosphatase
VNAIRNNINGFVRNDPDGTVFIEAEGNIDDLENYLKWCQNGPQWANIDRVDVRKSPLNNHTEFVIQH